MEPNAPLPDAASINLFLATLRAEGASAIDAIKAVREKQKVSLGDAKRIVLNSPAWIDAREAQVRLFDEILAALESE